jgi:hypothetical protein
VKVSKDISDDMYSWNWCHGLCNEMFSCCFLAFCFSNVWASSLAFALLFVTLRSFDLVNRTMNFLGYAPRILYSFSLLYNLHLSKKKGSVCHSLVRYLECYVDHMVDGKFSGWFGGWLEVWLAEWEPNGFLMNMFNRVSLVVKIILVVVLSLWW